MDLQMDKSKLSVLKDYLQENYNYLDTKQLYCVAGYVFNCEGILFYVLNDNEYIKIKHEITKKYVVSVYNGTHIVSPNQLELIHAIRIRKQLKLDENHYTFSLVCINNDTTVISPYRIDKYGVQELDEFYTYVTEYLEDDIDKVPVKVDFVSLGNPDIESKFLDYDDIDYILSNIDFIRNFNMWDILESNNYMIQYK